jgi:hypothetical protein
MTFAFLGIFLSTGIENNEISTLSKNGQLVARRRPFHCSSDVFKVREDNGALLLRHIPDAHGAIGGMSGQDILSRSVPRASHDLFAMTD